MEQIFNWIFSEAGAGWIIGVLSLIVLLITRLMDKRPSRIVFKEVRKTNPISIRPGIKDKIKIIFQGREVSQLGQIESELFNEGKDPIKKPVINIEVPDSVEVLDCSTHEISKASIQIDKNIIILSLDYLNPYKEHKQKEIISIITSGKVDSMKVYGSGEGWSVKHLQLPTELQQKKDLYAVLISSVILLIVGFVYGMWIMRAYGIGMRELSLRAFIAYIPIMVPLLIWCMWVIKKSKHS